MHSYNNWFNWEWRSGKDSPTDWTDQWMFKPKQVEFDPTLNFKGSIEKALNVLSNTTTKELGIMYSGGLDSEVILRTAIDMEIPLAVFTIRFNNGLNEHDIEYAARFCKRFGIKIEYIDIDINSWLVDETDRFSFKNQIKSHGFFHAVTPLHFWARNYIQNNHGDFAILNGSGDVPLGRFPCKFDAEQIEWVISVNWDSHYKRLKLSEPYPEDVPLFFSYIPEIHYSFLTEKELVHCVSSNSKKLGVISSRHALYHRCWPDLEARKKYTGFEKLDRKKVNPPIIPAIDSRTNYEYRKYLRFFEDLAKY